MFRAPASQGEHPAGRAVGHDPPARNEKKRLAGEGRKLSEHG